MSLPNGAKRDFFTFSIALDNFSALNFYFFVKCSRIKAL